MLSSLSVQSRKSVLNQYLDLPQNGKVQVTYIWIDGTRQTMRSKARTFNKEPTTVKEISDWSFCGFGTYMSDSAKDSEFILKPAALYPDPFTRGNNKIVLCDTYQYSEEGELIPTESNRRAECKELVEKVKQQDAWFGIEQEYTLLDIDCHPIGWPKQGYPAPMGPYYCGVGCGRAIARDICEAHYKCMLASDINVYGINAEAMPSQWEWQLTALPGLQAADELWMSRYLLYRLAEDFNAIVSFDPKPVPGTWNGSGAHFNFSTKSMREDGGIKQINEAIESLSDRHKEHISVYDPTGGQDNMRRLTGTNETASIDSFTHGVGDRTVSVRISKETMANGKGYLEDRRPSSNCDPYDVVTAMLKTCCLNEDPEE